MSQIAPETQAVPTGEQLIAYYTAAAAANQNYESLLGSRIEVSDMLNETFEKSGITSAGDIPGHPIMIARFGRLFAEGKLADREVSTARRSRGITEHAVTEITETLRGRIAHVTSVGDATAVWKMRWDGFGFYSDEQISAASGHIRISEYPFLDLDTPRGVLGFRLGRFLRIPILNTDNQPQVEVVIE